MEPAINRVRLVWACSWNCLISGRVLAHSLGLGSPFSCPTLAAGLIYSGHGSLSSNSWTVSYGGWFSHWLLILFLQRLSLPLGTLDHFVPDSVGDVTPAGLGHRICIGSVAVALRTGRLHCLGPIGVVGLQPFECTFLFVLLPASLCHFGSICLSFFFFSFCSLSAVFCLIPCVVSWGLVVVGPPPHGM